MIRNLERLTEREFDVLIIGGGIYGATAARDASSRGLSVALVEKGDFGGATSMNSLKTVHGGLRYLQQLDFKRMRESIGERSTLLRIAPHLVEPLPFLIPTYGHGTKGREALALGLMINDIVGYDRNRGLDPSRHIPSGRMLSREECRSAIPGIDHRGLTGGALWHDCLMYSTERLLLSFLLSAEREGAVPANYAEALRFIIEGGKVLGAEVRDVLTGDTFVVRARVCLNMTGPWLDEVIGRAAGVKTRKRLFPSKAMNIVVGKLFDDRAVGLPSSHTYRVGTRRVKTGSRYLFAIPWRGHTLIGTTHLYYDGTPDGFSVTEEDIGQFLEEVNGALPSLEFGPEDVLFAYGGILPMTRESADRDRVDLVKHYRIHDHGKEDSLDGLVSVLGVKYTTARDVSKKAIDHVFRKLEYSPTASVSTRRPLAGGDIEHFDSFAADSRRLKPASMPEEVFDHLLRSHGTDYVRVLALIDTEKKPELAGGLKEGCPVIPAQVLQAVREEMAVKLTDAVMRRTELGSTGYPGEQALRICAGIMAGELGWDPQRTDREMEETRALFRVFLP